MYIEYSKWDRYLHFYMGIYQVVMELFPSELNGTEVVFDCYVENIELQKCDNKSVWCAMFWCVLGTMNPANIPLGKIK